MLNLLVLYTEKLEENLKFYESLGLEFKQEQHGSGPVHYAYEKDGVVFELYPTSKNNPTSSCRVGIGTHYTPKIGTIVDTMKATYQSENESLYILEDPDRRKVMLKVL